MAYFHGTAAADFHIHNFSVIFYAVSLCKPKTLLKRRLLVSMSKKKKKIEEVTVCDRFSSRIHETSQCWEQFLLPSVSHVCFITGQDILGLSSFTWGYLTWLLWGLTKLIIHLYATCTTPSSLKQGESPSKDCDLVPNGQHLGSDPILLPNIHPFLPPHDAIQTEPKLSP